MLLWKKYAIKKVKGAKGATCKNNNDRCSRLIEKEDALENNNAYAPIFSKNIKLSEENEMLSSKMQTATENYDAEAIANNTLQRLLAKHITDVDIETTKKLNQEKRLDAQMKEIANRNFYISMINFLYTNETNHQKKKYDQLIVAVDEGIKKMQEDSANEYNELVVKFNELIDKNEILSHKTRNLQLVWVNYARNAMK